MDKDGVMVNENDLREKLKSRESRRISATKNSNAEGIALNQSEDKSQHNKESRSSSSSLAFSEDRPVLHEVNCGIGQFSPVSRRKRRRSDSSQSRSSTRRLPKRYWFLLYLELLVSFIENAVFIFTTSKHNSEM